LKILLTSTSFQDTPGKHHDALSETGFEVDKIRGPVKQNVLLPIIEQYDGVICGEDIFSREVIEKGNRGKLKVISKYGIGLDKINLKAASELGVEVTNCPGVNHITVAEHVFALLLTYYKNIHLEYNYIQKGQWTRLIGHEIFNKKIGIIGLGRIGKEVAKRALAFGLDVFAYDIDLDQKFIQQFKIKILSNMKESFQQCDIVTIHMNLTEDNKNIISDSTFDNMGNNKVVIVNTARADLIEMDALINGLNNNYISAYLTDVLEEEPMNLNHPLQSRNNVIITPHIGSRTYESVQRQGQMAVDNLLNYLNKYDTRI